jgi:hypothetical protein
MPKMETTNISPAIESHKPLSQQYEAKVILTNQCADSRAAQTNYFTTRLAKWTDQWAGSQPAGMTI